MLYGIRVGSSNMHNIFVFFDNVFLLKEKQGYWRIKLKGDDMIRSRIGEHIDNSPYKNEYVRTYMQVSRNTLSNWRTGKAYPTIEKAFMLSRLLKVSVEDLFEYKEE